MAAKQKARSRIEIRVTEYERNRIMGLADIYAGGNISLWIIWNALYGSRKMLTKEILCQTRYSKQGKK